MREAFVDKVTSALSILGYDASIYAGIVFGLVQLQQQLKRVLKTR